MLGHTGAAAGLASIVKTSLCLSRGIIPAFPRAKGPPPPEGESAGFQFPACARPWPPPADAGPRRAVAAAMTSDGNCMHVVLERCEPPPAVVSRSPRPEALDPDHAPGVGGRNPIRVPVAGNPIVLPGPPRAALPIRAPQAAAAGREITGFPPAGKHRGEPGIRLRGDRQSARRLPRPFRRHDPPLRRGAHAPGPAARPGSTARARFPARRGPGLHPRAVPRIRPRVCRRVLGPEFAEADAFPTRVRLPDEPLMLVDRILRSRASRCRLTHGRVVTEHDVRPGAWYLDCGRIPTCIAVEAGQADLFLSGYLGIDLQTRGRAVYRLLDATVDLPPRPAAARARSSATTSASTVSSARATPGCSASASRARSNGEPLLTMTRRLRRVLHHARSWPPARGSCAPTLDLQPRRASSPADWDGPRRRSASRAIPTTQLDACGRATWPAASAPAFAGLPLREAADACPAAG